MEPLSKTTLDEATNLRDRVFTYIDDIEKLTFIASLNRAEYQQIYRENEIETMQYWVARDKTELKVIGFTGIYTEPKDNEDSCWLGWFCIDPKYRGIGFGKELLEFSIDRAKELSKKYLHLYTYDSKEYQPAINLYKQYGFEIYKSGREESNREIYMKRYLK